MKTRTDEDEEEDENEDEDHIGTHRKNKQQQIYWPLRGCL